MPGEDRRLVVRVLADLDGFVGGLKEAGSQVKDFAGNVAGNTDKIMGMGGKLTAFVTGPLALMGAAGLAMGKQFDTAFDTLAVRTGASGEAMRGLERVVLEVMPRVTQNLATVTDALAPLAGQARLTGENLRDTAVNVLDVARLTGQSVKGVAEGAASVFKNWGVAQNEAAATVDKFFDVSQRTGASIAALMEGVGRYGVILRGFGVNLDEAMTLLGTLLQAGVPMQQALGGLQTAFARLAKTGIPDLGDALRLVERQILQFPTDMEAVKYAADLLGARLGPRLALLIREGKISLADLATQGGVAAGALERTKTQTDDFGESLSKLGNAAKTAAQPMASDMYNAMNLLIPATDSVTGAITGLGDIFRGFPEPVKAGLGVLFVTGSAMGPALIGLASLVRALTTLKPVFAAVWAAATGPIGLTVGAILGLAAAAYIIYDNWDWIKKTMGDIWEAIKAKVVGVVQAIVNAIQEWFVNKLQRIVEKVRGVTQGVAAAFDWLKTYLVGSSVVPETVEQIGRHMETLDVRMGAPTRQAVTATAKILEGGTLTWRETVNQGVSQMNFAWGQLSSTVGQNLAEMTRGTVEWGQVMSNIGVQILGQIIGWIIQLTAQWILSEATRAAATTATNATVVASNTAAAGATTSVWAGAGAAIVGMFGAITGAIGTFMTSIIIPMLLAVGKAIVAFLSAVAEAMADTIFGIPIAVVLVAAIGGIIAAMAALGALKFAKGGIAFGPAIFGEGSSPEAAIPLDRRGARFMASMLDLSGSGTAASTTVVLELDGKSLMRYTGNNLPSVLRLKGVLP